MKIALLRGRVIDPTQSIDAITDLGIDNGKIAYMGALPRHFVADQVFDLSHCWVIPGMIDLCCRPQMPHPQGVLLDQEAKTALVCGMTRLCIPPDGDPIIDHTASALRIARQLDSLLPALHPMGALTPQLHGKSIADLTALADAGCFAFTQAQCHISDLRILRHCYDYAASFSLPVIIQPQDPILAKGGVAHEGTIASRLGLPGIPTMAETIAIAQQLPLIEESGIRAHFTCLSSAKSVAQIKEAKARGLPVTADVAMHSLYLTESAIETFDSNCHVYPPLRTEQDRLGLLEGLQSGTIDAICSDHRPLDSVAKLAPFGDTLPGLSALDCFVPLALGLVEHAYLSGIELVRCLSTRAAAIFGLPGGTLRVGAPADVCVIDPNFSWEVSDRTLKSRGKNTPFKGQTLRGKVRMTLLNGQIVYSHVD